MLADDHERRSRLSSRKSPWISVHGAAASDALILGARSWISSRRATVSSLRACPNYSMKASRLRT